DALEELATRLHDDGVEDERPPAHAGAGADVDAVADDDVKDADVAVDGLLELRQAQYPFRCVVSEPIGSPVGPLERRKRVAVSLDVPAPSAFEHQRRDAGLAEPERGHGATETAADDDRRDEVGALCRRAELCQRPRART